MRADPSVDRPSVHNRFTKSLLAVCAALVLAALAVLPGSAPVSARADTKNTANVRILLAVGNEMGSKWNKLFQKGASAAAAEAGGTADLCASTPDAVKQALRTASEEGYACAVILSKDYEASAAEAQKKGLQVVSLGSNGFKGYTLEDPEGLGYAMGRYAVDRAAVAAGRDGWYDSRDFNSRLYESCEGLWQTANSSADRAQIEDRYFLQYVKSETVPNLYVLSSTSFITDMTVNLDSDKLKSAYIQLNSGLQYYTYPDLPDYLECRWEPDGYSGSDSLSRVEDAPVGTGANGSAVSLIDTGIMDETPVTLTGYISLFNGHFNMDPDNTDENLALNLEVPVRLKTGTGIDMVMYSVSLHCPAASQWTRLEKLAGTNKKVTIEGVIWESETMHQYTPAILSVQTIK
ncbi:MAG: hypothetical protein IJG52_06145 [Lachnospiraceae bacterium]|nr:hypothetical protein [Lachnospiraceae bacterium]